MTNQCTLHIITPDRPGYGLSDFQPKRRLLDFPSDIEELADALNLDTFAIIGISAGGPYVAACAYKLPQRVTTAAIVSGIAPINRKNAYEGMHDLWRITFKMSKYMPSWLLRPLLWLQFKLNSAEEVISKFAFFLSDYDREVLSRPEVKKIFISSWAEATRKGVKGMVREAKILVSPWGFPLEDITTNIHLWYWENDFMVPLQMGKYLEEKIPNTHRHFLPNGGHLAFIDYWREILESIILER